MHAAPRPAAPILWHQAVALSAVLAVSFVCTNEAGILDIPPSSTQSAIHPADWFHRIQPNLLTSGLHAARESSIKIPAPGDEARSTTTWWLPGQLKWPATPLLRWKGLTGLLNCGLWDGSQQWRWERTLLENLFELLQVCHWQRAACVVQPCSQCSVRNETSVNVGQTCRGLMHDYFRTP